MSRWSDFDADRITSCCLPIKERDAVEPCPREAGQQEQAPLSQNLFPNRFSRNCLVERERRETVQARVRLSPRGSYDHLLEATLPGASRRPGRLAP